MRARDLCGVESEQVSQDVSLDHTHDSSALVAPKLYILAFNNRYDTAATLNTWSRTMSYDRHQGGQFVARVSLHISIFPCLARHGVSSPLVRHSFSRHFEGLVVERHLEFDLVLRGSAAICEGPKGALCRERDHVAFDLRLRQ